MNKKGFTLVEIIVCVAIISVIGVVIGLNSDKMFKKEEVEPTSTKIESAASVYAEGNRGVVAPLYAEGEDRRGFINLTVGELIDNGLISEDVIGEPYNTTETIERTTPITVTLNDAGELDINFGVKTEYGYAIAHDITIASGDKFECDYSITNTTGNRLVFSKADGTEIPVGTMQVVETESAVDNTHYYCNIKEIAGEDKVLDLKDNKDTTYEIAYVYQLNDLPQRITRKVTVKKPIALTEEVDSDNITISSNNTNDFHYVKDNNIIKLFKSSSKSYTFGLKNLYTTYDDGKIQLLYEANNKTTNVVKRFTTKTLSGLNNGQYEIKIMPLSNEKKYSQAELEDASILDKVVSGNAISFNLTITDAKQMTIKSLEYADANNNPVSATAQVEGKKITKINVDTDVPIDTNSINYKLDTGSYKKLSLNTLISDHSKQIEIEVVNKLGLKATGKFDINIVKSIAKFEDNKCTPVSNQGCFYKGDQSGNYVNFAGQTWRIYQKDANKRLHLILDSVYDSNYKYLFTETTDRGYCSNDWCCNGGSGTVVTGKSNPYLMSSVTNKLDEIFKNRTTEKNLTEEYAFKATYPVTNNFYATSGGLTTSLTEVNYTRYVGLLNYDELKLIANCNSYINNTTCGKSYLDGTTYKWGLATTVGYSSNSHTIGTWGKVTYDYQFITLGYESKTIKQVYGKSLYQEDLFNDRYIESAILKEGESVYLRPVIVLKSSTKITGGDGTFSNKYTIG